MYVYKLCLFLFVLLTLLLLDCETSNYDMLLTPKSVQEDQYLAIKGQLFGQREPLCGLKTSQTRTTAPIRPYL